MINDLITVSSTVLLPILTLNIILWYFQTSLGVSVELFMLRHFIIKFASDILKETTRIIQKHGIIEGVVGIFLDELLILVLNMDDIIELCELVDTVALVRFIIQFLRFSNNFIVWDFNDVFILNFLISVSFCVFVFFEFNFAAFIVVGSELEAVEFVLNLLSLFGSFLMVDCSLVLFKLFD